MSVLALVPARGGSKGLPGKNLAQINGRSLVARAVELALSVPGIHRVAVSSEDPALLREGQRAGGEAWERPPELAGDTTPTIDVVLYHLQRLPEVDALVLLQPTSPLRAAIDVTRCIEALDYAEACATVCRMDHPWQWAFHYTPTGIAEPVAGWGAFSSRRQDLEEAYRLNGAVYAATRGWLERTQAFIGPGMRTVTMPPERSVDIDTALDLTMARALATTGHSE